MDDDLDIDEILNMYKKKQDNTVEIKSEKK